MSQPQVKRRLLGGYVLLYDCKHCGTRLTSPIDDAGVYDSCPECAQNFVVPGVRQRDEIRQELENEKTLRNEQRERTQQAGNERKEALLKERENHLVSRSAEVTLFGETPLPTAIRRCPYCAEEILTAASKCKHCGEFLTQTVTSAGPAKVDRSTYGTVLRYLLYASALIVFLIIVEWGGRNAPRTESSAVSGTGKIQMIKAAQRGVRGILKSPSSAEFPSAGFSTSEYFIEEISPNTYRVRGYVDAQNSFGAKLRNDWEVICKGSGLDWYAESARLLP